MADPKLNARLGLDKREFDKGLKQAEGGVASFGNKLKSFAAAAGLAVAAQQLIKYGAEAVKLAAKTEGIKNAFDRLNNPNLLNNLQKATRNTVADVDLMSAAVRANNFHISLEALPKYFEFAQQRARATGESVDYLVESIVMGIGRKSAMILDNLGISLEDINNELKVTPDYATAVGNIMTREMAKGGETVATTADSLAQMQAAMTNLKAEAGDIIIDVLANPLAKSAESLTDVISGISQLRRELDLGGANKDLANQVRGNISMASGTAGGYLMSALFGGRKAGKNEILIPAAAPIIKKAPSAGGAASAGDGAPLEDTILGEGYWQRAVQAAVEYNNYIEANGLKVSTAAGAAALPSLNQASSMAMDLAEPIKEVNKLMIDQTAIAGGLESTFTGMFMNIDQGFKGMADSLIQSIKRIAAEIMAQAAAWAVMKYIFKMDVGNFSSFMGGGGGGVNAGAAAGVGSSVGGDLHLTTYIRGTDLAVVVGRGGNSRYNNT